MEYDDPSQSVYLLGKKGDEAPLFKRCRKMMEALRHEGEFLCFENTPAWLSCYSQDAQFLHAKQPLLVFRPHTVAGIAPFMQKCCQLDLAVTVRSGGTGLAGGCVPSTEGILLLTGHLRKMWDYNSQQGRIRLEPGVTIRQLNQQVEADGWHFPLSMATQGVAGMAGCLNTKARGYHQQEHSFFDSIETATIVDGQGNVLDVPAAMICGAEGLWGIVIEMKVQLKPKPAQRLEFSFQTSWEHLFEQLPFLYSLPAMAFIFWSDQRFHLGIEGEGWRLACMRERLISLFSGLEELPTSSWLSNRLFELLCKPFVVLTTTFHASQLPEAIRIADEGAKRLELNCRQKADVLAGSLHLILNAEMASHTFSKTIEEYLVFWAEFVDKQKGVLASCHGVGMQMHPYMSPFWSEETLQILQRLQSAFDPGGRLRKERFFPVAGKSLEKIWMKKY